MAELRDPLSVKPAKFSSSFDPVAAMNLYGARKIKAAELKATAEETKRSTSISTIMDAAAITTKLNEDKVNIIQPMVDTFTDKYTKLLATQNYQLTPIQQLQAKTEIASMKALAAVSNQQAEGIYKMYAFANEHQDKVVFDETMDNIKFNVDPETWLADSDNWNKKGYKDKKESWDESDKNITSFRELSKHGIVYKPEEEEYNWLKELNTAANYVSSLSSGSTVENPQTGWTISYDGKYVKDADVKTFISQKYVSDPVFKLNTEFNYDNAKAIKDTTNELYITATGATDALDFATKMALKTIDKSSGFSATYNKPASAGLGDVNEISFDPTEQNVNVTTPALTTVSLKYKNNINFSTNTETGSTKTGYQFNPRTGIGNELSGDTQFTPQSVFLLQYGGTYYSVVSAKNKKGYIVWMPFSGDIKNQITNVIYPDYTNWPDEETLTYAQLKNILEGKSPTTTTTTKAPRP